MRNDKRNPETPSGEKIKDELARDEGVLSRWSRRKKQEPNEFKEEEIVSSNVEQPETEQLVLTDADMPAVEDLNENSDYSGFLSPGVSEELRAIALRRLFRSAKFNIRDGLDDYDDDFRTVTLLKDVLMADVSDKLEQVTKQDAENQQVDLETDGKRKDKKIIEERGVRDSESDSVENDELTGEHDEEKTDKA